MKKIFLSIIIALFLFAFTINAENLTGNSTFDSPFQFPTTLNLNKLKTSQSLTFTSIMSSNSKPIFISNFQNRFRYNLSSDLKLQIDLNIVNFQNSNIDNDFSLDDNSKVLPNFRLDYSPNDNFHLRIEYNSYPGYYSRYPF